MGSLHRRCVCEVCFDWEVIGIYPMANETVCLYERGVVARMIEVPTGAMRMSFFSFIVWVRARYWAARGYAGCMSMYD
jgi:hypothetical protein